MKFSEFDLLSPEPLPVSGIGSVKAVTLRHIAAIGFHSYQLFLSLLLLDTDTYFKADNGSPIFSEQLNYYASLSDSDKVKCTVFDFLVTNPAYNVLIQKALSFFITGEISFHEASCSYQVQDDGTLTGNISRNNWNEVCGLILQRQHIAKNPGLEDAAKAKNARALKILEKLKSGAKQAKQKEGAEDYELSNIISALAARSSSLNIISIWDATVYQLFDQFNRQQLNAVYDIQCTSASVWGTKGTQFNINQWFSNPTGNTP